MVNYKSFLEELILEIICAYDGGMHNSDVFELNHSPVLRSILNTNQISLFPFILCQL